MHSDDSGKIKRPSPGQEELFLIGQVNHFWAALDALSAAAFVSALSGDPVEIGITLGRLDAIAKLQKLKAIYRYRRDEAKVTALTSIIGRLDKLKPLRNAITHGLYRGKASKGELLWSIMPEFLIGDDIAAFELFVSTTTEIQAHAVTVHGINTELIALFGDAELKRLLDLPSLVRSHERLAKPPTKRPTKPARPPRSSRA